MKTDPGKDEAGERTKVRRQRQILWRLRSRSSEHSGHPDRGYAEPRGGSGDKTRLSVEHMFTHTNLCRRGGGIVMVRERGGQTRTLMLFPCCGNGHWHVGRPGEIGDEC